MENQETHLLQNFSEAEKLAYLSAIATMAGSDGQVSQEEAAFIQALSDRSDLSEEAEQKVLQAAKNPTPEGLRQHLDTLKNSQLRFSLITDLISFAYSDNAFTEEEKKQIQEIAAYLNINAQQYQALQQFVQAANTTNITEQDLAQPQALAQKTGMGNMLENAGINSDMLMKGALGILAPIVLSRVLGGSGGGFGRRGGGGGMMGGGATGGGGLGGLLGSVLGGMAGSGSGGYGRSGGGMMGGGGLGSLVSILGGLSNRGGYSQRGGVGGLGGLGGLLGGMMGGGGRKSGW